jgi:alcohol/geraniol dehydrogenase (NADP+)
MIHAYAADKPKGELKPFQFEPGPLAAEEVEIAVEYCGVCHSDLSMLDNDWGNAQFPLVPGHEVVGKIAARGEQVKDLQIGQRVGLGWYSHSCGICQQCMSGDHNLCPTVESTIVGRFGGFADRIRAHREWTLPLPEKLDPTTSGPLFCGGVTVFNPLVQLNVHPTDHVGVVGIGGLGHLALQFLHAWGCEVTAFTTSDDKQLEAEKLGANHVVNTRKAGALEALGARFDAILVAANADLDWPAYANTLRPRGRLHFVGVPPSPISVPAFPLIGGQRSITATPLGSPATTAKMLDFSARHGVAPIVEMFPMSKVNEAMKRLRSGKTRYRIVLEANK